MAKLILNGTVADVQLTSDPVDGQWIATCVEHSRLGRAGLGISRCPWTDRYDTLNDAAEYASDHADRG